MPTGVYLRTDAHKAINLGRKHSNRKVYKKGITQTPRLCLTCSKQFFITCLRPKRKFCSRQCYPKNPNFTTKGKKGSEKQREMMKRKTGENHFRWIKDRTQAIENHRLRNTEELKLWRQSVFSRDDFTCQECRAKGGNLEAHHILVWRDHPELRYIVTNGITLCRSCHFKTRWKEHLFVEKYNRIVVGKLTKL